MSVDLSICVVNFNSARFLPMLADSIRAQDWQVDGRPGTWELIVVDNASRGEDAWAIREMAQADERVRRKLFVGVTRATMKLFLVISRRAAARLVAPVA